MMFKAICEVCGTDFFIFINSSKGNKLFENSLINTNKQKTVFQTVFYYFNHWHGTLEHWYLFSMQFWVNCRFLSILWWFAWPWRTCLGHDKYFKGCSLKPKSGFIVLLQRFLIQKLMEGHQASRVLHVTEPTCTDALFIKYWSGCVRTRGWKPRLCGKPQLQKTQAFMNNLGEAL